MLPSMASFTSSYLWYLVKGATNDIVDFTGELVKRRPPSPQKVEGFQATIDLTRSSPQSQSILFQIPPEIRNRIFEYALAETDDPSRPYGRDRSYYRPDEAYHPKSHVSLLQTCKVVYRETRLLPVALAKHTFWMSDGPCWALPMSHGARGAWKAWQNSLNTAQKQAVEHVRFIMRSSELNDLDLSQSSIQTRRLTFVVRGAQESTNFPHLWSFCPTFFAVCPWIWGHVWPDMLKAQPVEPSAEFLSEKMTKGTWGWQVCQFSDLDSFTTRFEVEVGLAEDLDTVLFRAKHWLFPLHNSNDMLVYSGTLRRWSWKACAEPRAHDAAFLDDAQVAELPQTTYLGAEMVWTRQNRQSVRTFSPS
jgi:hypothetical protein